MSYEATRPRRELLRRLFLEGRSNYQIVGETGYTIGTVRMYVHYLRMSGLRYDGFRATKNRPFPVPASLVAEYKEMKAMRLTMEEVQRSLKL